MTYIVEDEAVVLIAHAFKRIRDLVATLQHLDYFVLRLHFPNADLSTTFHFPDFEPVSKSIGVLKIKCMLPVHLTSYLRMFASVKELALSLPSFTGSGALQPRLTRTSTPSTPSCSRCTRMRSGRQTIPPAKQVQIVLMV